MSSETNARFFAEMLNERGLIGSAVEVGVYQGRFSHALLTHWRGSMLNLVDPWSFTSRGTAVVGMQEDLAATRELLAGFGSRTAYWVTKSVAATKDIPDDSLDFAYIDGLHHLLDVTDDLQAWWPKLKQGGVFAGHDYRHNCGVPKAVLAFARQVVLPFTVVPEVDHPRNALWHMTKE